MYRAIGFDYGGVIGGVHTSGPSFSDKVCNLLGLDKATYREVYFSLNGKVNLGEIESWSEFWRLFLEKIGKPEKLAEIVALDEKEEQALQAIDPEMLGLVDEIRSSGYRTGLLSNNTIEGGKRMRTIGLNNHFDVFHISAETKLMKPDPEAFKSFTGDLAVNMHDLIFIDDSESSLSSAEECGYTPILFTDIGDLRAQLQGFGVL